MRVDSNTLGIAMMSMRSAFASIATCCRAMMKSATALTLTSSSAMAAVAAIKPVFRLDLANNEARLLGKRMGAGLVF